MCQKPIKVVISFVFLILLVNGQSTNSSVDSSVKDTLDESSQETQSAVPKSIEGWGNIALGLPYSQARKNLQQQFPEIVVDGDDFLDLPEPENKQSIRAKKTTFFDEISLFFDKNEKLYLIHLQFSQRHFSFLTLLQRLKKKYGNPTTTSFHNIVWKGEKGNIELFRTLIVRYIRKDIAEGRKENQEQWNEKSAIEQKKKLKKEDVLNTL